MACWFSDGFGTGGQPESFLQQALALSPGEPIVLEDLAELAEELGRHEDLAELVQNWQAVEGWMGSYSDVVLIAGTVAVALFLLLRHFRNDGQKQKRGS